MARPPAERPPVTLATSRLEEMSKNERLKVDSRALFLVASREPHPFRDEVEELTRGERVTLSNEAKELSKFFGVYRQQARGERGRKTDDHFFMVRIRNPGGGRLTAAQWVALDEAADLHGDGTLRITSRQGLQYHRVYGPHLAPLIRHLNRGYRDRATLGACGDVNRNVMVSPIDDLDPVHEVRGRELAEAIAEELAPKTSAYFEIWLTDEAGRKLGPVNPEEPLYGLHYLPRKFKIGIGHPEENSIDVLTQDVGLVPVVRDGRADGESFDLYSGGGLGMTHNMPITAPYLGLYHGRIRRDEVVPAVLAIAILQRDHGERKDRRRARWKYTLRRLGLDAVNRELRSRFKIELEDGDPQPLGPMRLHLGWHEQRGGGHYYGLHVENGRLAGARRRAVREAVEQLGLEVRLTPQQDLLLLGVRDRAALEGILARHGIAGPEGVSRVRANAMACPAKPTCGLAMTEAETILPSYIDAIEEAGLGDVDAVIRMTGCPNMCARPPTAEIGIYGYGKNDHVILVGGSREGTRLGHVLFPRLPEEQMRPALVGLFRAIREHCPPGRAVGDFLHETDPETLRGWIGLGDG